MEADTTSGRAQVASCPHCHKPFSAELLAGGAQRHRGFKCPHCKLFVPEHKADDRADDRADDGAGDRAEDAALARDQL